MYLGLQVDASQGHLGHLVEAGGQRDGTQDKEAVVDGDAHQDHGLHGGRRGLDQQGAHQVHPEEEDTHPQEDQVQGQPAWPEVRGQHTDINTLTSPGNDHYMVL